MTAIRPSSMPIGPRELRLPVFFPSVSSIKTALRPAAYLEVLSSLVGLNNQFLVSAFDLAAESDSGQVIHMLKTARESGALTLMDSGNYESFWKDAQTVWTQADFHKVLHKFNFDIAFGFDEQCPPSDFSRHVALVVSGWHADQAAAGDTLIVPIVHGTADMLPALVAAVVGATGVPMIAVAERRLGDGVISRARTVGLIRQELDRQGRSLVLHLLGTGNPISIALYSEMGADSFDGLEWCQTVVDHDTSLLYHLSHADFFAAQTSWTDPNLSFHARTLAHNLEFYSSWMQRIRAAVKSGTMTAFCRHNLPERVFKQCASSFGWK